ncbi:MAG: ankyrin repeat domain-containing protein [Verrucomicrobiaceae bacterium]|nr:MAG: ankyrin repeat domain-containing protein [Verrucomicrobiaceae bacterium]
MTRRGIAGIAAVFAMAVASAVLSGCFRGEGMTPLMLAAHDGSIPALKERIASGDDLNARSRYGWTALMFASWKGHREQVVALLDAGADPNLISGDVPSRFETVGGTPPTTALRQAIESGHGDIARLLMNRGAKPDAGAAALAGGKSDEAMLEELQRRGVDWNQPSPQTWHGTAVIAAAARGNRRNLDWLLKHGADPNLVAGSTALKEAVNEDDPETVRFLLERGADPNVVYWSSNETALFTAVSKHVGDSHYNKNLEVIRLLLKHGADRNHRSTSDKLTALEWVQRGREGTREAAAEATDPQVRKRLEVSMEHKDSVIRVLDS